MFGDNLNKVGAMCELAQDVHQRLFRGSDLELALVRVNGDESSFVAYGHKGGLGTGWSVGLRFRQLPSDDYACTVQLMWSTPDGHCVDAPITVLDAPSLFHKVDSWFADMEKIHNGLVNFFSLYPR